MSISYDVQTRAENNTIRKTNTKKIRMGGWIAIRIGLQVAMFISSLLPWMKKATSHFTSEMDS